jgi:hypothetical protein
MVKVAYRAVLKLTGCSELNNIRLASLATISTEGTRPKGHDTDVLSGVLDFAVSRFLFFNLENSLLSIDRFISHDSGVWSIEGLHLSKESWY